MSLARPLLFGGLAVVLAGGVLAYHFRGRIRNHFFPRPQVGDYGLYVPSEHLFKKGNPNRKEVCLTIDDGPHPSLHRILPILQKFGVHATFFMVGFRLASSPVLVRQTLDEGNEIGNHTQTHPRLTGLSDDDIRAQLGECEAAFEKVTGGRKMALFRPPGLDVDPSVYKVAWEFGYTTVFYTCGAKDFILKTGGPNVTIGKGHIVDDILKQAKPGSIILLHDTDDTADALPAILEGLQKEGFAVKDVSEMLADLPKPIIVKSDAGSVVGKSG